MQTPARKATPVASFLAHLQPYVILCSIITDARRDGNRTGVLGQPFRLISQAYPLMLGYSGSPMPLPLVRGPAFLKFPRRMPDSNIHFLPSVICRLPF